MRGLDAIDAVEGEWQRKKAFGLLAGAGAALAIALALYFEHSDYKLWITLVVLPILWIGVALAVRYLSWEIAIKIWFGVDSIHPLIRTWVLDDVNQFAHLQTPMTVTFLGFGIEPRAKEILVDKICF